MSILVEIMRTRNPELEILCIQTAESYFDKQEIAVFQWQYHLLRVFVVLVILNSKDHHHPRRPCSLNGDKCKHK